MAFELISLALLVAISAPWLSPAPEGPNHDSLATPRPPEIYLTSPPFLLATGIFGCCAAGTLIGMLISGELIFSAALAQPDGFSTAFGRPTPPRAVSSCSSWDWRRPEIAIAPQHHHRCDRILPLRQDPGAYRTNG